MGELHAHVHGFVNGQEIPTLECGWDTPLQPEDVLDFLPPVAGG
ncbi:MAG TPA: MoaD/ThiS family protein [Bellilinea sp.]|nr:MoaD/ThiS family protein [Bellilinea sp.]